jgi:tetratricopeptide (TPR) repeat protein
MEDISIYLKLAEDYLEKDNFLGAIACYEKISQVQPDNEQVYLILGDLLVKLQEYKKAVIAYKKAKQLDPKLPFINKKIGQALQTQAEIIKENILSSHLQGIKEFPHKLVHYHKALEFQPRNIDLYLGLVRALIEHKKFDEAIAIAQIALIIDPKAIIFKEKIEEIITLK